MSELNHPDSINRDYIRLLQVMRRFVKEEFAVSIRMTQDDAIEQLLHYADLSRNNVLQEMAKELREFTATESEKEEGDPQPDGRVRYYRGAAILIEDNEQENPTRSGPSPQKAEQAGGKKIYRGRVING